MIEQVIATIVETVLALGYPGILVLMAIESSFIPFPSELVLPPAGYLAAQGKMHLGLALAAGLSGSLIGALFNYWFAIRGGEPFLRRYGKYFFVSAKGLDRAESFFRRHGEVSTFVGRLVPVVRQLISVPAGMARMRLGPFVAWTALGAGIWCVVLLYGGWILGRHGEVLREAAVQAYTSQALLFIVPALVLIVAGYILWHRKKVRSSKFEV